MKRVTRFASGKALFAIVALAIWLLALPSQLTAQTNTCSGSQGQNGVYNPTCNKGNPGVVGSSAFIDASTFAQTGFDFCKALNGILSSTSTQYPSTGAVIDARGLPGNTGTSTKCSISPWAGITSPPPSVILLPAQTITIPSTWILPNNTKLIGEGYGTTGGTVILACTTSSCPANLQAGTSMIQFGIENCSPGPICAGGISVENLHRQRWKSA